MIRPHAQRTPPASAFMFVFGVVHGACASQTGNAKGAGR